MAYKGDMGPEIEHAEALLSAIIVALARTWEAKLPGFVAEFRMQLGVEVVNTPVGNPLRQTLEELISRL
jgi:hypothetical protein